MTLAAALSLLLVLPNGFPVAHLRNAEPGYLEARAAETVRAARVVGLPVAFLAGMYIAESGYDRYAVSFNGTSLGIPQLNKWGPWYRQWQTACSAAPAACSYAGILIGARVLKAALVRCRGDRACAVATYRVGHPIRPRPRDRAVVRLAGKIAWLMKRPEVLL